MGYKLFKLGGAEVRVFQTGRELAEAAAGRFTELANHFINAEGRFTVALSGGSTPRLMFELLATRPPVAAVDWSRVCFFWSDERCVPPDDAESNYRMARETLLSKIDAPEQNIFRIPAEISPPELAARKYAAALEEFFGVREPEMPGFDLVMLGMGADAHTASLFPHTAALRVTGKIAAANYVDKLGAYRITLTAEAINRARNIIFLVAGSDKAQALAEVVGREGPGGEEPGREGPGGGRDPESFPSQLVRPQSGSLLWMTDEPAFAVLGARLE
ncbi:MAG TPA: 6-phosphogluconolactonase [Blastocatellia bacterium]|nr:6-phosphogluconolactonase [Blastocatellia bacterium]